MSGSYSSPIIAGTSQAVIYKSANVNGVINEVSCDKAVYVKGSDGEYPSMNITLTCRNMTAGYTPQLWFYNVNHDFHQLWFFNSFGGSETFYFDDANVSFTLDPTFTQRAFFRIKPRNNFHGCYTINIYFLQITVYLIDPSVSHSVSPLTSIIRDLTGSSSLNSNLSGSVHNLNGSATIEFQAKDQDGGSVPFTPFAFYKNSDVNTNPIYYISDVNGACTIHDDYVIGYRNKYVPYIITQYNSAVRLAQLAIPWFSGGVLPTPPNTLNISCSSTGATSGLTTFYNGTGATLTVTGGTINKSFVVKNVSDNIVLWNGLFDNQGKATVYISNSSTAAYITKTYTVESMGNTASCSATWYNVGGFYLKSKSGYSFTRTDSSLNTSAIALEVAFSAGPGIFYYGTQVTFHVVDRTSGGAIIGANDGIFAPYSQTLTTGTGTVNLPSEWLTCFAAYPGTYNIVATAKWNNIPFWWMFVLEKPLVVIPASLTKTNILNAANKATTPMIMTGVNVSSLLTAQSSTIAKYVNVANATVVVPAIDNDGVSNTYTGFVDNIPDGGVLYIPSKPGDTFIIQYKQYTATYNHLQDGSDNITVVDSAGRSENFNPVPVGGTYFIGAQRFVRIAGGSGLYAPDYDVVCFLADAPVLTPSGYRAIGSLKVGDLVMTADGTPSAIQKVKVQHVNPCSETNPYSIPKGQFGATRRLLISPNHKVLVEGRGLVEARNLGLEQKSMAKPFDYYNLELESSKNMIVAGVVVESLAPKRRFVLSAEEFRTLVLRNFGRITPEVQERLRAVSRVLADGRVEFIATAQR